MTISKICDSPPNFDKIFTDTNVKPTGLIQTEYIAIGMDTSLSTDDFRNACAAHGGIIHDEHIEPTVDPNGYTEFHVEAHVVDGVQIYHTVFREAWHIAARRVGGRPMQF